MESALTNLELAKSYIGKSIKDLPVPAFVLDKSLIKSNAQRMHSKLKTIGDIHHGLGFRPHVKTLKTVEVTREALGNGATNCVVASTIAEIRGLKPLVQDGSVCDILYGVPVGKSHVQELATISQVFKKVAPGSFELRVFIDHPDQLDFLLDLGQDHTTPWSVFIKTDSQDNRAGVPIESTEFKQIVSRIRDNPTRLELFGFYVHAGTSYNAEDLESARRHLQRELTTIYAAAATARQIMNTDFESGSSSSSFFTGTFTLSFGATPTAHALSHPDITSIVQSQSAPKYNDKLELHAGNFVALDLQQASSNLADSANIAGWVESEIVSYYGNTRNEYLLNAGVLALTREPGRWGGFAYVKGMPGWKVTRVSQEHGILSYEGEPKTKNTNDDDKNEQHEIKMPWKLGDRVSLYPQHMCITSAMHKLYFIVDGGETIVDIWEPWRFW